MNEKQVLTPVENKGFLNLTLKPKFNKTTKKKEGGLEKGNFILIEKVFPAGKEYSKTFTGNTKPTLSYSCRAKYNGQEVSFWLNAREHEEYAALGGIGDTIKITRSAEDRVSLNPVNGSETFWPNLEFELVNGN